MQENIVADMSMPNMVLRLITHITKDVDGIGTI